MEYLSKQQLILLALLVSFVTSMATGIFTVSLMDQNPAVGHTITQVIERTIQSATQDTSTASAANSTPDDLVSATANVSKSIVHFADASGQVLPVLGLIVSSKGVIITDKNSIASAVGLQAILADKSRLPVAVVQSQVSGDIAFLAPIASAVPRPPFSPIVFGKLTGLGQSLYSLDSGDSSSSLELSQGLFTSLGDASSSPMNGTATVSIPASKVMNGSPLFAADGSVIGIHTSSLGSSPDASQSVFYLVKQLQAVIPPVR